MFRLTIILVLLAGAPVLFSQSPLRQSDIRHRMEQDLRQNNVDYQKELREHREDCKRIEQRIQRRYEQEDGRIRARYRSFIPR
jgi:hypothetical protein